MRKVSEGERSIWKRIYGHFYGDEGPIAQADPAPPQDEPEPEPVPFMTIVTVWRKGRCWIHAQQIASCGKRGQCCPAGQACEWRDNCLCGLQVIWQDVVPSARVREIAGQFEAAGRVVGTRVCEPA